MGNSENKEKEPDQSETPNNRIENRELTDEDLNHTPVENFNILNKIKKVPGFVINVKDPIKTDKPPATILIDKDDDEVEEKLKRKQLSGNTDVIYAAVCDYESKRDQMFNTILDNFPNFLTNSKGDVIHQRIRKEIQNETLELRKRLKIDEIEIFKKKENFYEKEINILDIHSDNLYKELAVVMNENQLEANKYSKRLNAS